MTCPLHFAESAKPITPSPEVQDACAQTRPFDLSMLSPANPPAQWRLPHLCDLRSVHHHSSTPAGGTIHTGSDVNGGPWRAILPLTRLRSHEGVIGKQGRSEPQPVLVWSLDIYSRGPSLSPSDHRPNQGERRGPVPVQSSLFTSITMPVERDESR